MIGGLGSLWGTLAGGIVLGVAQTVGAQIDPQYSILAGHLVFLAVLASPRGGIFRRGERRMSRVERVPSFSAGTCSRPRFTGGFRPLRRRARLRAGGAQRSTRRRR